MLNTFENLNITENEIRAKFQSIITIDKNDYGDDDIVETNRTLILPGVLDIYIPHLEDFCHIIVEYNIELNKMNEVIDDMGRSIYTYEEGDIIINQKYKTTRDVMRSAISLLQGRMKYIKNPITIITLMNRILPESDLVHLELIIANMFRDPETLLPARFDGNYEEAEILGQTEQGKTGSWFSSVSYRDISKSLDAGLISGASVENNPIEKLLNEDFDQLPPSKTNGS